jgi:6-methylsalicylate decarboxylase
MTRGSRGFLGRCLCCDPLAGTSALSRRGFIAGATALGAFAATGIAAPKVWAQAKPHRVDVHHHFFPPQYLAPLAEWNKREGVAPGLQPPQTQWTPARAVEEMDRAQVATAILSISTPGVWFGDAAGARAMARQCNEYAADMVRNHPGRFGLFASTPMPDVDGTLKEIEYALHQLKADGVCLMTSYGDKWPGDPVYAPVFEELNRRKAIAYFHPVAPNCCGNLMPGVPAPMIEYPHDTARAVSSLLFNGAFARHKDVRFIFSHAGASVPALAGRMINAASRSAKLQAAIGPNGIEAELRKLYYDTANSAYAPTMAALLKLVPVSQVLFGSDYPYLTVRQNLDSMAQIGLSEADLRAIDRENAITLLPRLSRA